MKFYDILWSHEFFEARALPLNIFLVGLGRTILGTENVNEMLSSNRHDYVGNKFERREPVKNCKPIRSYERPTIAMECTTTTQSQFTHHQCLPSEPFRPSDNIQ